MIENFVNELNEVSTDSNLYSSELTNCIEKYLVFRKDTLNGII